MKIKQKCVDDIHELIIEKPTVISPKSNTSELLKVFCREPRTRHIYVVDKEGKLIGSVRLNDLVELIMPYLQNLDDNMFNKFISGLSDKPVSDIMRKDFLSLKENIGLTAMISTMLENNVNELPVVDDNGKVVGEVNFLEFIKYISDNEHLAKVHKVN